MRSQLLSRLLAVAAQAAAVITAPIALAQTPASPPTPFASSTPIAGRYIVVLKAGVANPAAETARLMQGSGGQLHHTYSRAIKGFAASLPDAAVQALRANPNVQYVEQDKTVSLKQVASPQNQVTWGLDRIDQADRPLDTQYHFNTSAAGVNAFIIDTGIRYDHFDFTGRMKPGYSAIADTLGTMDCNGHGTHVAGTVGGSTWGVAKGVSLIPVRVLDCSGSGSWSGVIAGIDWVAASPLRPAVANLSLGGGASTAVDAAVAGAVTAGVTMVVAAGNSNADACNSSPARERSAITVGATTSDDARATYSNYGSCVDLFAPGSSIKSAFNSTPDATYIMSGTSMASPHVAGAAALLLAANPGATPADITNRLLMGATPNRVTSAGTGSPNLLLNSLGTGGGGGGTITPAQPTTQTVAFKSMAGSATRTGGNWKATAVVAVRDVNTGAGVSNATVNGSFSMGGTASCVTGSNGSCTLSSGSIKSNAGSATTLTATGVSGALMTYDASQNTVSQIVIAKP